MKSAFEQLSPGKIAILISLWNKHHMFEAIILLSNWLHDEMWLHPTESPVADEIELLLAILKQRWITWGK